MSDSLPSAGLNNEASALASANEASAKDEVFGAFLEELEIAPKSDLVVQRFAAAYPEWADEFREEVGLNRLLDGMHPPRAVHAPDQFPEFRIVRWIATGGMGILYEAEQLALGRRVALKVRHGSASAASKARFDREQRVLARLHQSHIVPIHAAGQSGEWQFFAMTFIDGASLHGVIAAAIRRVLDSPDQPLPSLVDLTHDAPSRRSPDVAAFVAGAHPVRLSKDYVRSLAAILADAAEALDHAHRAQVSHRDVKPSNILVDRAGQCFVIDFGLAAYREDIAERPEGTPNALAGGATRGIFGTPEYMPPERFGEAQFAPNPAGDIWGLGVTLYELLTLRRAFRGDTIDEIRGRIVAEEPTPIERLAPDAPLDLIAICRRAMNKRPEDRYRSAADMAADLRRWLRGEPTSARPARRLRGAWMWCRRNTRWAVALALLLMFGVVAATFGVLAVRAEARRAEDRAALAENLAAVERRKAKLEHRESLIQEAQRLQFVNRFNGWSIKTMAMLKEASDIRPDARVRDLAINALSGIDLRMSKRFARASSSVAFDATGRRLLFGGLSEGLFSKGSLDATLWDADTGREHPSERPGSGPVAFAADGTPLQLTIGEDGKLVLWDVARRSAVRHFSLAGANLISLSPDASVVAASSVHEKRTRVWSANGDLLVDLPRAADVLALAPGRFAMASDADQTVTVRSLPDGKLQTTIPLGRIPTRSLALGGTSLLAIGDAGGSIAIYDGASSVPINFCRGSIRDVFAMAFSPDGAILASAGREEGRLWDVSSGKLLLRFRDDHGMDFVTGLAFSTDGRQLAVSNRGVFYRPSVTVWEVLSDRGIRQLSGMSGGIEKMVVSPDGRRIAALAQSWTIAVWDLPTGRRLATWAAPPGAYADNSALTFSPDGQHLAYSVSQTSGGHARLWVADTGVELRRWTLPPGLQNQIAFDPNDPAGPLRHFQVEGSVDGMSLFEHPWKVSPRVCRVRDLRGEDPAKVLFEIKDFPRYVYHSVVTPDKRLVIVDGLGGDEAGPARRWVKAFDLTTGQTRWSIDSPRTENSSMLAIDPTGQSMCCTFGDTQRATIVNIADAKIVSRSENDAFPKAIFGNGALRFRVIHQDQVGGFLFAESDATPIANVALETFASVVSFDVRGETLFWGGRDGVVRVCDLRTIARVPSFGFVGPSDVADHQPVNQPKKN